MPNPLSASSITAIQPLIDAIDAELELPQELRSNLTIPSTDPKKLKNYVMNYKSNFRREEWNLKFHVVTHLKDAEKGPHIYVDFNPKRGGIFFSSIIRDGQKDEDPKLFASIIGASNVTVPVEMTDDELVMHILTENPQRLSARFSFLSEETQNYLRDPQNVQPSALMTLLTRKGLHWITTGDEQNPSLLTITSQNPAVQ
jgi:hypothetical protein